MAIKRIVVIGASSGGIEALRVIAAGLPKHFPAAVCMVVHTSPESPGVLDSILSRAGPLPAMTAKSGERLRPGSIYVPPPDHHLLIAPGILCVTRGPKENRFRPAIDPLFRSAAQVFGPAAIGVILTGSLDDGTAGLWTIRQLGGIAVVQDPADALFPSMPANALRYVNVDHTVPLSEMAPLLVRLVETPVEAAREPTRMPAHVNVEIDIAKERSAVESGVERIGEPSQFTCPECHGVLLKLKDVAPVRFRCHTGHAFSRHSLVAAVSDGIEESLWSAIRALEEGALLMEQLAEHVTQHKDMDGAQRLMMQAREARRQATVIRQVAAGREELSVPGTP